MHAVWFNLASSAYRPSVVFISFYTLWCMCPRQKHCASLRARTRSGSILPPTQTDLHIFKFSLAYSETLRLLRRRRFASHCFLLQLQFFLFVFHLVQHSHLDSLWRLFIRRELPPNRLSMTSNLAICAANYFKCSAGDL